MMNLQVSRHSLGTQTAFVHREIVARLKPNNMIVFDQQIHAALHGAVRAMGWHNSVYHTIRTPPAVRRVMQVWTVSLDYLFEILYFTHASIFRLVATLNARPLKYASILLWQRGICQPTYDSLAARTVVLPDVSITHLVIKAEFLHDRLKIPQPHLSHKFNTAARTNSLRHFPCAALIEFDTNRGGSLDHMKEFAKWQVKQSHDHNCLMRQRDE